MTAVSSNGAGPPSPVRPAAKSGGRAGAAALSRSLSDRSLLVGPAAAAATAAAAAAAAAAVQGPSAPGAEPAAKPVAGRPNALKAAAVSINIRERALKLKGFRDYDGGFRMDGTRRR